jgi:Flp pilus assembly protein TadG
MKALRNESGQALIFVALSLTGILGLVGLATDIGSMLHTKRNLQIAADSAAIAGASELNYSANSADVIAAAQNAATQNGVTDGSNGATVTVNPPPVYGPNAGQAGYVEVIVSQKRPAIFPGLFGWGSITVNTRAVAWNGAPGTACIYALNQTGADTIHLQGSFDVSVPGCEVVDDSSDPNALYFTGAGGTLSAGAVGVVGGAGGQTGDSTPAPVTGIAPVSNPLASVQPPTYDPSTCSAPPTTGTWGAGLPADGSGVVCYSGNITIQTAITMNPGTYVFTGTLDLTGNGSLTGNGVTLYIAPGGSLGGNGNGNTTLNLTAPQLTATATSPATCSSPCPYNGILIYQDPLNTTKIELNGDPIANFVGMIYAPTAELELSGNTTVGVTTNLTTDLIVGSLYDKGNATINITDYSRVIGGPLKSVALVE